MSELKVSGRPMTHDEVREAYQAFFEGKGHTRVASDSLIPSADPSLLFTGAGMNQFKDHFLGTIDLPFTRATSCQKCLRTQDLDVVGTTAYHQTFFEMLGNFSFGDYFKKEAITWAWEFLTEVLLLNTDKLFVSVYENDQAAYDIWLNDVGLAPERIQRLGPKDNFWPANAPADGPNGPCGPCSEIFFDYGGDYPDWHEEPDSPRFAEIWNLVFTQFDRQDGGKLEPLPQQNIDTGMGFERICMVLQGKTNNFDTDLLRPLMDKIEELAGPKNVGDGFTGTALENQRRVADHAKAATFCVVDGVRPGNEGRPYVLRKLIRRAVRDGRSLGIHGTFVHELSAIVAKIYTRAYPEVAERLAMVQRTIKAEEERFLANLDRGETLVADVVAKVQAEGGTEVSGARLFELFATHGQPLDMTEPLFEAAGLTIDRDGYDAAMEEHRRASKGDGGMADEIFQRSAFTDISKHTEFLAWETMEADGAVLGLLDKSGEGAGELIQSANANQKIEVLLDRSPFYPESGGQIGDTGVLRGPNGVIKVTDTQKLGGIIRHLGAVIEGTVAVGETVVATVDRSRRAFVTQNHTATHLMHAALRAELGTHVEQQGSLVTAEGLRFDFSHPEKVDAKLLAHLEDVVNKHVRANIPRQTDEMSMEAAIEMGAIALFGEKYGDKVRVCWYDDVSIELCGGTHLARTGDIGLFTFVSEGSVSAGVRRVEAITGNAALQRLQEGRRQLQQLGALLKVKPDKIGDRVQHLLDEQKAWQRKEAERAGAAAADAAKNLTSKATEVGGHKVLVADAGELDGGQLRKAVDAARAEGVVAIFLASQAKGKAALVAASTLDAVHAGNWVKECAPLVQGGGGGKPDMAQAGGKDPAGIPQALEKAHAFLQAALGA